MPARTVRSFEEIGERMREAPRPTADEVPVTHDGRRLDTLEKVLEWVSELNGERAREEDGSLA